MNNQTTYTCQKCNTTWIPRKQNPKTCPNPECRTRLWKPFTISPQPLTSNIPLYNGYNAIQAYKSKALLTRIDGHYAFIMPDDWINNYVAKYQDVIVTVRIRGQGIYIVPDHELSAKQRVMAKHPNCHTIMEVIDEQCQQQGITHEQYFARLTETERATLSNSIQGNSSPVESYPSEKLL